MTAGFVRRFFVVFLCLSSLCSSAEDTDNYQIGLSEAYLEGKRAADKGDFATAKTIWLGAAMRGDPQSEFSMAQIYERGLGVDIDPERAAFWHERAAASGLAAAQFNLANAYAKGFGVNEDPLLAALWWRRAAEQGLVHAQYNLAVHLARGLAPEERQYEAVTWLVRAKAQGHAAAAQLLAQDAWSQLAERVTGASVQDTERYTVQVGALSNRESADRLAQELAESRVFPVSDGTMFIVTSGSFATLTEARARRDELFGKLADAPWVRTEASVRALMEGN